MCLLYFIHYTLRSQSRDCCKALLEDWVTTDNGVKPKTWEKLIEVLSDIEELQPVIEEIKQKLISEGVTLVGVYEGIFMYMHAYVIYVCMYSRPSVIRHPVYFSFEKRFR